MNTHILCLNLIILLASTYPTDLAQLVKTFMRKKENAYYSNNRLQPNLLRLMFLCYVFTIFLIWIVSPQALHIVLPKQVYWYILALAAVPFSVFLEYAVGNIMIRLSGHNPKGCIINYYWQKTSINVIIFTAAGGLCEEIIFRQIWFHVLGSVIALPVSLIVIITAIVYSLNHLYFGFLTIVQKFFTGLVYGLLFYASGGSLLIPLIAHGIQNLLISGLGGMVRK